MSLEKSEKFFTSRNRALFFIIEETALLFLIVLQIYLLLGIQKVNGQILFFQNQILLQNILWLVATIVFFLTLYISIASRDLYVKKVHAEFTSLLLSTFKSKVFGLNGRVLALLLAELVFTVGLAASIFLYLDPEVNIFPFPSNILAFIILVIFGYFVFKRTRGFREEKYGRGFLLSKIAGDNGPHKLVRITNKKTGSIRVKRKIKN